MNLNQLPLPSKNALTPILWAFGIIAVPLIPASVWLPTWVAICGWVALFLILGFALWAFQHFVRNDPNQLRSEEHSLKLKALNVYNRAPGSGDQIAHIIGAPTMSAGRFLAAKGESEDGAAK
jgi:hypothetical protein